MDSKGYVISAATRSSASGIVGGHAYSVSSVHTLSNGARVLKIRNTWGNTEWTGAYSDSDAYWTKNTADANKVGFTNSNDGTFIMKVEDFKTYFADLYFNVDTSNWHLSYWLKLGNADTIGKTGNWGTCGSTCKNNKFTITSPVKQTIHVATHMHM